MGWNMSSAEPSIDDFAALLIREVRDEAIDACDSLLSGHTRGVRADRWNETLTSENTADTLAELIPDIVDQVLFNLLDAVDNERLQLAWKPDGTSWIDLSVLGRGEMGGWVMSGKGGWIDRFSAKRFVDPFPDLP